MEDWLGSTWSNVAGVVVTTVAVYLTALVAVRVAGRRTLSQMSAFDIVVTVAIGSLIANTATTQDPSYLEGAAALSTLLALQVAAAWLRRRSTVIERMLEFRPQVVWRGQNADLPEGPMKSQLTETELWSQLRQEGIFDAGEVALVVLEPTGRISVARAGERVDPARVPD